MNLWRFVPAVSRPWNPAYRDTWDAMTRRERQVSFLIDAGIFTAAAIGCYILGVY
jgi:hypothetical protein